MSFFWQEDILEVFLIDTSTEEDVCLSAEMVRSGHADARHDSAFRVSGASAPASASASNDSPAETEADVRTLLAAIQHLRPPDDADAASEVSASASEIVGRPPRRLPVWDGDGAGVLTQASSVRLARLRALRSRLRPPEPTPDDDLTASNNNVEPLRNKGKCIEIETADSGSSLENSVVSVSSRMLQRRLALAKQMINFQSNGDKPEKFLVQQNKSSSQSAESDTQTETDSIVSVSSRLLQKRLALAKKLNSLAYA